MTLVSVLGTWALIAAGCAAVYAVSRLAGRRLDEAEERRSLQQWQLMCETLELEAVSEGWTGLRECSGRRRPRPHVGAVGRAGCDDWIDCPQVDDRLRASAHHEAGHAVIACCLSCKFDDVTISSSRDTSGCGSPEWNLNHASDATDELLIHTWAGQLAEERYTGVSNHRGAFGDNQLIHRAAVLREGQVEERVAALKAATKHTAGDLLDDARVWGWVCEVAVSLLAEKTLTLPYGEVRDLCPPRLQHESSN